MFVEGAEAISGPTLRAFWSHVGSHASIAEKVYVRVSAADALWWLTRERDADVTHRSMWMLRVVDAPAAIAARGFPAATSLSVPLDIADDTRPANSGRWELTVAEGKGTLNPLTSRRPPRARRSPWARAAWPRCTPGPRSPRCARPAWPRAARPTVTRPWTPRSARPPTCSTRSEPIADTPRPVRDAAAPAGRFVGEQMFAIVSGRRRMEGTVVGLTFARHPMRVLGVDPGLTRCGVGVVDGAPGRALTLVRFGVIKTSADEDIAARLLAIETELESWLDTCQPDAVAVERVFSQHNVRTVMGTAQAGAIAIACAARRGLPVALHTPSEVKAAVTGSGRAGKEQVTTMVTKLLRIADPPRPADAADALALAICHLWRGGAPLSTGVPLAAAREAGGSR